MTKTATASVTIKADGFQLDARVPVPLGPTRVLELLPLARGLSDEVVRATASAVEDSGAHISCKAGCGACCRNLVMISALEARQLRTLVNDLPEPRQSEVRARFVQAKERFAVAGLLPKLQDADAWTDADYTRIVNDYFQQGVACPFLENESCSIHTERPITCREYLVVSPPEHCANVGSEGVVRVQLPIRVFNAVARWQTPPGQHHLERALPLILALDWADAHPEEPAALPGPQLLQELLDHLSDKPKLKRAPSP